VALAATSAILGVTAGAYYLWQEHDFEEKKFAEFVSTGAAELSYQIQHIYQNSINY
jgi:hypothetical protein